jgi:c-di-AMP phosphodiesterase-like protein
MKNKKSVEQQTRGWLPKEPTVSVIKSTSNRAKMGKWAGEKMLRLRYLILLDIVATFIAALLVGFFKGYNASIVALFLGLLSAIVITRIFGPNHGYKRLKQNQLERLSKFKEKLATEGVIDETVDIARAGRIAWWWSEQKRSELLSHQVTDFGEVMRTSGKTYVIDRQTLSTLSAKLPIKDQELNKLTQAERRIFDVLRITGDISLGEKEFRFLPTSGSSLSF